MMIIKVNGDPKELAEGSYSVGDLLKQNGVAAIETVSVQLNGEFLDQADYAKTLLKPEDELDFLYFLGGGSVR